MAAQKKMAKSWMKVDGMILNKKPTEGRNMLQIFHSACKAGNQNDLVQYFVEFCASIVEFWRWSETVSQKTKQNKKQPSNRCEIINN